jgi:hypothetical protein
MTLMPRRPKPPANIGKRCRAEKAVRGHFDFTIVDEFYVRQSDMPNKLIYLQKMKFESDGREELRLGYYIIGKRKRMRGRWVWGQFATMIPMVDFRRVIVRAEARGWL